MKNNVMLTVTSLLSILLFSIHLPQDILRGIEPGTLTNLPAVPIMVVWLYGALVLAERRSGQVIMLLGSLLAVLILLAHLRGAGVGGAAAKSSGAVLYIWTIFGLGVTGTFSVILSVRALRQPRLVTPSA